MDAQTITTTVDKLRKGDAVIENGRAYPVTYIGRRMGSDILQVRYGGKWYRLYSTASITVRRSPIDTATG